MECKLIGLCGISKDNSGKVGLRTMKMTSMVSGIPLVVLVDIGDSHNFISPQVVSVLGLKVDDTHVMSVKLGDGHRIETQGRCPDIKLRLGELDILVEAFIMELGGIDVILGVVWLETLGKVMEQGREIKLCSATMGQKSGDARDRFDSLHSVIGERVQLVDGLLRKLEGNSTGDERMNLTKEQHKRLNELLNKFPLDFREPNGLPPSRGMTHSIILQKGSSL